MPARTPLLATAASPPRTIAQRSAVLRPQSRLTLPRQRRPDALSE